MESEKIIIHVNDNKVFLNHIDLSRITAGYEIIDGRKIKITLYAPLDSVSADYDNKAGDGIS